MPKVTEYPRGIRPTANGVWRIDVCVKGTRKTASAETLEEAKQKRLAIIAELSGTSHAVHEVEKKKNWSLEYAYDKTLELVWAGTKSEKSHKINAGVILEFFGRRTKVKDITTDKIGEFSHWLMEVKGVQGSTVNRKLAGLSRILRTAMEHDVIPKIPKMHKKPERSFRIRYITPAEESLILDWMLKLGKTEHYEATIVLLDTGMRCSELWALTAADINLTYEVGMGAATVWHPKNYQPRTVPLTTRVREILQRRTEMYPTKQIFPGSCKDWFHLIWSRVRNLMGMDDDPHFVPHILRHTCCSRLVQRGFPLVHVQQWMGHLTIQTTMRYAHLAPQSLVAGVQLLEGGERARWSTGFDPEAKPVDSEDLQND